MFLILDLSSSLTQEEEVSVLMQILFLIFDRSFFFTEEDLVSKYELVLIL